MNGKLSSVTIVVKDQKASVEFYTEKVGFEIKTDFTPPGNARWVTVGPKGQDVEISLYQHGTRSGARLPGPLRQLGNGMMVVNVENCQKAYEELKAGGVPLRGDGPSEQPWGTYVEFDDPDGNHFTILQPRAIPGRP